MPIDANTKPAKFHDKLLEVLGEVDRPGNVCTSGDRPLTMPGLLRVVPRPFNAALESATPAARTLARAFFDVAEDAEEVSLGSGKNPYSEPLQAYALPARV